MNRFLSVALLLLIGLTSVSLLMTKDNSRALPADSSTGKAEVGGSFTLTDINGNRVSDSDFRGKYMLVFFGFTRCPDICPLTMTTLTSTWELLGKKGDEIVPIFISVDPAYDTPQQIKTYLSNFDKRIVGLTGTREEIEDVASLYKAYFSVNEPEKKDHAAHGGAHGDHSQNHAPAQPMVDHSSLLYLMDKNGEYVTHFPHTTPPEALAKALNEQVK